MTETELRAQIGILEFRIERNEKLIKELDNFQRETLRIIGTATSYNSFCQMQKQVNESGILILAHKKDLRKMRMKLDEHKKFLLYLLKQ